jgi:hypothetical protein
MIRHVAMFRWAEGITAEQLAAVRAGLDGLPGQVPSIRSYVHGPDLGLGDDRWDYVVVASFDDADGYHAYVDHPAHDAVRRERIRPLLADRAHIQIDDAR